MALGSELINGTDERQADDRRRTHFHPVSPADIV